MFILAALAVLGGDSLQDFAIALLVGLIVGTYSSVFAATPLLTYFQAKWPMSRVKREKVVRGARGLRRGRLTASASRLRDPPPQAGNPELLGACTPLEVRRHARAGPLPLPEA